MSVESMTQVVVALTWEQADYLLNILAVQQAKIADVIYDQIEQTQTKAIEDLNDDD